MMSLGLGSKRQQMKRWTLWIIRILPLKNHSTETCNPKLFPCTEGIYGRRYEISKEPGSKYRERNLIYSSSSNAAIPTLPLPLPAFITDYTPAKTTNYLIVSVNPLYAWKSAKLESPCGSSPQKPSNPTWNLHQQSR